MLNINNGIRSLTEFKQNSSEILANLKKTHSPTVLTVNGRAEVVLIDPKTYQEMVEKIYLAESARRIENALTDIDSDKGIDAKETFEKIRKKYFDKDK